MRSSEQDTIASGRCIRIRALNDRLRTHREGGKIMMTRGVAALGNELVAAVLKALAGFDAFTTDNAPYGEHDMGAIEVGDHVLLWKIDYYDKDLAFASPDPSDPEVTTRVLTLMLAEDY